MILLIKIIEYMIYFILFTYNIGIAPI